MAKAKKTVKKAAKKTTKKAVKKTSAKPSAKKAPTAKKAKELTFREAFTFPFNRFVGLFNIFWILVPIFGWFALGGYKVRITQMFIKGNYKQLPEMHFVDDMILGAKMFFKAIPLVLAVAIFAGVLQVLGPVGTIATILLEILVLPVLILNFLKNETVASSFELGKARAVFENLWEYIVALLKDILLAIVFVLLTIVLVGFPAGVFSKSIYLANFFNRFVK